MWSSPDSARASVGKPNALSVSWAKAPAGEAPPDPPPQEKKNQGSGKTSFLTGGEEGGGMEDDPLVFRAATYLAPSEGERVVGYPADGVFG